MSKYLSLYFFYNFLIIVLNRSRLLSKSKTCGTFIITFLKDSFKTY